MLIDILFKFKIKCLEKLKTFNRVNNRFGSDPYSDTKLEGKECEWLERLKYYAHSAVCLLNKLN